MNKAMNGTHELAVIHLHDDTDDFHFTSELYSDLFSIGYIYHHRMREDVGTHTLDSLAVSFSEYNPIDTETFAVLVNAAGKDERIKTIVDFDFENGYMSVWEQQTNKWNAYPLKDISSAIAKATQNSKYSLETQIAVFDAHLDGKNVEFDRSKATDTEDPSVKAGFVRNCFRELLSDGKPHRYSEIVEYTTKKARGTEFFGGINKTAVVLDIKPLINKPDADYLRVRHGYYQMKTPEVMLTIATEKQGNNLYSALDNATALREQLANIRIECCDAFPEISDKINSAYKIADACLDKCIDGLSFWMADIEDISSEEFETEDQSPTMTM